MKHLNFFQGHFKKIRNKYDKYFVSDILKRYHVHNFKINDDLTVDTSGDVNFSRVGESLPPIQFGRVLGSFICSGSNLTSLKYCPNWVGGDFGCNQNNLRDLIGAPKYVGGHFIGNDSYITSLEGAPETVGGTFYVNDNQLVNLIVVPKSVGGRYVMNNNNLYSFEGFPENFNWENQQVDVFNNPVREVYGISGMEYPKFIYWLNEYDVIQHDEIMIDRLEGALHEMGWTTKEGKIPPGIKHRINKLNHYGIV